MNGCTFPIMLPLLRKSEYILFLVQKRRMPKNSKAVVHSKQTLAKSFVSFIKVIMLNDGRFIASRLYRNECAFSAIDQLQLKI